MENPVIFIGVTLALIAAIASAGTSLLVRVGTSDGNVIEATAIVISINTVILVPPIAIIYYPEYGFTRYTVLAFIAAGISGTLIGRFAKYLSISRIGASRTVPITSSYALIAAVLGVLIFDEQLTLTRLSGMVLIFAGVAGITWRMSQNESKSLSRRKLLFNSLIPLGAAVAYGWEPIFANYGFSEGTPAPVGLAIKSVAATLSFFLYLRLTNTISVLELSTTPNKRWFVFAGIANSAFLLSYYVSLSIAPVSIVVPIIISSTLFVLFFSHIFLPQQLEEVTWQIAVAALTVVFGILLVSVSI